MSMELIVESTTKEAREAKGRKYWGVRVGKDTWYNCFMDEKPTRGQKLNVDVKESEYNGKTYRWAEIVKAAQTSAAPAPAAQNGAGHSGAMSFDDCETVAREAHRLALELEPDDVNLNLDRAQARAAIVNTFMIAFTNGKIAAPEGGPPPPTDDDDRIPF
jgi:hypothetical protein